MSKINQNQLKNMVTWLKNYANAKISSNSNVTLDPNSATKEYVDTKMMFDGYETILDIPADDITNAAQKYDNGTYRFSPYKQLPELHDDDEIIIEYEGKTFETEVIWEDGGGRFFDDGALIGQIDGKSIVIINRWDLYTNDINNRCCISISPVNTYNITDLVVKRKSKRALNVLTITKAEYNALATKDNATIYLIIE